jgi:hypothetical protein
MGDQYLKQRIDEILRQRIAMGAGLGGYALGKKLTDEEKAVHRKGALASTKVKNNPWVQFLKENKGTKLTVAEKAEAYDRMVGRLRPAKVKKTAKAPKDQKPVVKQKPAKKPARKQKSDWAEFVEEYRESHPGVSYKEAIQEASPLYFLKYPNKVKAQKKARKGKKVRKAEKEAKAQAKSKTKKEMEDEFIGSLIFGDI